MTTVPAISPRPTVFRAVRIVMVLGMAVLVLAGCSPEAKLYARIDGSVVDIAVCESIAATKIEVSVAGPKDGQNYRRVWTASGKTSIESGDVIRLGTPPDGMSGDSMRDINLKRDSINVSIYGSVEGEQTVKVAVFDAASLSSKKWRGQTSDAGSGASPCT